MGKEDKLREKFGNENHFSVPDDYFSSLNKRIMDNLPDYPEAPRVVKLKGWDKFKPYVYLAAMFAGIWLMMHLFHNIAVDSTFNIENPPVELVQLIESEYYDDFVWHDDADEPEYILEEEVFESYDSIEDFEKDFGYTFKPEYAV